MRRSPAPGAGVRAALLAAAIAWPAATGSAAAPPHALCDAAAPGDAAAPRLLIVSAFPAEIAPLVAATEVDATLEVEGRAVHLGRLGGMRVALALTGIGLVNAEHRTQALLARLDVAGVLMSGVAGSHRRIGDVVIARRFVERDRRGTWRANRALLMLTRRAAASLPAPLERCTPVPPTDPDGALVCMPHQPAVVFEKTGLGEDPFGGQPTPCSPGGGELFGCELPAAMKGAPPDVVDMETVAVARVATGAGVPFLGVRGVSDGAGDPLGDRGFPAQFADYYRLAARNAAALTQAVVAELGRVAVAESDRRACRLLARGRWRRAAARLRGRAR